ncbi:MAG: 3-oxoacyl-[acyl-carrier-protein] reductase [Chloroflexi bacterium]|nr:3-oxoacyl-[acyl-carrier-protein] reductase [Chloroflexota bacterium]
MSCLKDGKVAIVTGSSRGLGAAVVRELAAHGCNVAINYFQSKDAAEALHKEVSANGVSAIVVPADVKRLEECKRLVDAAMEEFGHVDILVNNAGVNRDRTLRRMTAEEWEEVIATDLNSVYYCTSLVVPQMIERNWGRVINMASIVGQMGNVGQSNYAAAKAGMVGFTRAAAQELARYNITVNALCPGFIETDMVLNLTEEVKQALLARIPIGRFGRPEEVARLCRFLVAEGEYITGAQLNINGGMYLQ